MAAPKPPRRPVRRLGFGRREKLVIVGALGLIGIGALHFLVFNPRSNALGVAEAQFKRVQSEYESLTGENYPEREIERYRNETVHFREELYRIVARENIALDQLDDTRERDIFRSRVKELTQKWYDYNDDPSVATDLVFIRRQPIRSQADLNNVAQGLYLWNLPDGLPDGASQSLILDNLRQARGKHRLIQRLGNDPTGRLSLQRQLNDLLRELGIEPFLVGADRVTLAEMSPPLDWENYRLPPPVNHFCAVANIELLLDELYPAPFDSATMERARTDPESLSAEQSEQYALWVENRETQRTGNSQIVGLEEMFDIVYDAPHFLIYNRTLDHIERLIDVAIEEEISSVRLVKIKRHESLTTPADPSNPPEETEEGGAGQAGPSSPQVQAQAGPYDYGVAAYEGEGAESYWAGYAYEAAPQPEQPVEVEDAFATVTPVFLQITGEYSQVWEFILRVSTGPHLYVVEELRVYTHSANGQPLPNLPEGQIAAEMWINVPIHVIIFDEQAGLAVRDLMRDLEQAAQTEPEPDVAEEPASEDTVAEVAGEGVVPGS
jgi:hypothetical protein